MGSGDHGVTGTEKNHLFTLCFAQYLIGMLFNIFAAEQMHRFSIMSLQLFIRRAHEPGGVIFKKDVVRIPDNSEPFF